MLLSGPASRYRLTSRKVGYCGNISMKPYPIDLLFFRTNPQVCRSVEPEPHLHSRPAVCGGEPGRESREDQVRCDERIRWQSKDGGQHCFPGGSSPQLKWIDYFITKFINYALFAFCNLILLL